MIILCLLPPLTSPLLFLSARYPVRGTYIPRAWDPRSQYSMLDGPLYFEAKLFNRRNVAIDRPLSRSQDKQKYYFATILVFASSSCSALTIFSRYLFCVGYASRAWDLCSLHEVHRWFFFRWIGLHSQSVAIYGLTHCVDDWRNASIIQ